jgi:nitrogen fixation NifU-like protein
VNSGNQPGPVDELTALYRETIVQHAVHPVGFQAAIEATHRGELFNPLCGDRIEVLLRIEGETISEAAFLGEACAICMASASLLCEHQAGQPVVALEKAHEWLEAALNEDHDSPPQEPLVPLLGVRAYPSRVRCALLPWEAAASALKPSRAFSEPSP